MRRQFEWNLPSADEFSREAFVASLQVTAEQRAATAKEPQKGLRWKLSRCGRLTASRFGAAAGHASSVMQRDVMMSMLWPEYHELKGMGKVAAQYGTDNEALAQKVYLADRQVQAERARPGSGRVLRLTETGLLVSEEHGWLGASPDFIIEEFDGPHERDGLDDTLPPTNPHHLRAPYFIRTPHGPEALLDQAAAVLSCSSPLNDGGVNPRKRTVVGCGEIKCPFTKRLYSADAKHAQYGFPRYYVDQIQGVMALNFWPWCDTVVFTPTITEVVRFYYDDHYWQHDLLPKLKHFYFDKFLPLLELRVKGVLRPGEITPPARPIHLPPLMSHYQQIQGLKRRAAQKRAADASVVADGCEQVDIVTRHPCIPDPLAHFNRDTACRADAASMVTVSRPVRGGGGGGCGTTWGKPRRSTASASGSFEDDDVLDMLANLSVVDPDVDVDDVAVEDARRRLAPLGPT